MKRYLRALAILAAATGATLAIAPAAAQAAPGYHCGGDTYVTQTTGGNYGILNGTQIYAPIDLGLDLTGNAVALLGYADARGYNDGCGAGHGHGHGHRHGHHYGH